MDAVVGNKGLFLTRDKNVLVECLNDLNEILEYYKNAILGENYVFKNNKKLVLDLREKLESAISISDKENLEKYQSCLDDLKWVVEKIYLVKKSIQSIDKQYNESLKRDAEKQNLPSEVSFIIARNLGSRLKDERDSNSRSSDANNFMSNYLQLSFDEQQAVIREVAKKLIEDVNTKAKENEEKRINAFEHKLRKKIFTEICFEKVDPTDPLDQRGEYRLFIIERESCSKCGMIKFNKINSQPIPNSTLDKETEEVFQRARNFNL